ncbi:MAG: VTT domain-containing protein [Acidobacteria bacterium]|nr:VTT domain-containing protein [Acidobacteriota bacterium]
MPYLWCFSLLFGSALLPWLNSEVIMASWAALEPSSWKLAALTLTATLGQMTGKCALYWAGRGLVRFPRAQQKLERLRLTGKDRQYGGLTVLFLSSTFGIPPFYPVSVLAGSLRIPFSRFLAIGLCGRLIHYSVVVLAASSLWSHFS